MKRSLTSKPLLLNQVPKLSDNDQKSMMRVVILTMTGIFITFLLALMVYEGTVRAPLNAAPKTCTTLTTIQFEVEKTSRMLPGVQQQTQDLVRGTEELESLIKASLDTKF